MVRGWTDDRCLLDGEMEDGWVSGRMQGGRVEEQ